MRQLDRIRVALFGLALAAPASVWAGQPGQPEVCLPCQEAAQGQVVRAPHLCADCLARQQAQGRVPFMMEAGEVCTACQKPTPNGSAPGFATAGGPTPGYASVGGAQGHGAMVTGEPAPIGVVQANFSPSAPAMPAPTGPGRATTGPMAAPAPAALPMATMKEHPGLSPQARHQTSILSSVFGLPRLGARRQARQQQARDAHAQISFGQAGSSPTDVPASMVYGR